MSNVKLLYADGTVRIVSAPTGRHTEFLKVPELDFSVSFAHSRVQYRMFSLLSTPADGPAMYVEVPAE
jgi:hypothetical protein